jgi:HrpA-like RNA helicase
MDMKSEGVAFPPVPVGITEPRESASRGAVRAAREGGEPRCEMCGYSVIASHCKRICLRCGFMTGCSEGI